MTETLITELSKIKKLKVISRTSVMRYKDSKKPMKQIAAELGVDALVEGSALRQRDRVRISVQLIDGTRDSHLWAGSFDREYKDVLALHSEVAIAIAREVKAALSSEESVNFANAGIINPQAYDSYLSGIQHTAIFASKPDCTIAIQMYEKATELDPSFALAYAMQSLMHSMMWWYGYDRTEERISRAKITADKALQLQPDLPEGHEVLGFYYFWRHLDYDRAFHEFAVAQKMRPNNWMVSFGIGLVLRRQGKMEQALVHLKKAFELKPAFR